MSSAAPPSIPPRPVKQQAAAQGVSKLPDIPPRPQKQRGDRSISPANFPGSPLNEPYGLHKIKSPTLPARPPSVHHLPTPGEEGLEYANLQYNTNNPSSALAQDAAAQTRTIAEDLHLHAPKPSLPKASATAQVQNVTKTDTEDAVGISNGNRRTSQDDLLPTRTRSRHSFARPESAARPDSAASGDRRRSVIYGDEQGPAEIGLRVPINPLLGDVQAPTPQGLSPQVTGESPAKAHNRKRSGMQDFRPPDSYGLHGHGVIANTKFEHDWYAKHPEQLEHEEGHGHGVYESTGSGRGTYALSSDELNKIVRDTASRGAGFGTREDINSYPDEQIGYMASENYQRSQQNTPQLDSLSRVQTHSSQPAIESPLRRASLAAEDAPSPEIRRSRLSMTGSDKNASDDAEGSYHIKQPSRKFNKVTGGQESMAETSEGKPELSPADHEGLEHTVPILADDEVSKEVGADSLHAAVAPKFERRGSQQHDEYGSGAQTPTSRPASRPGSIYQLHSASHSLSRFLSHQDEREHMHTPLEDVAEYEPLFEENEEQKAQNAADRFKKRPDMLQRRFPSQDIWEDTPSSAMHVAEVSTPDLPAQVNDSKQEQKVSSTFESPEAEHARKGEVPEQDKLKQTKEERLSKSKWAPHLRDDMPTKSRPALAQRFPSQDIWEDTPDSSYITTTVGGPQTAREEEASPVENKPQVPARPAKSRLGEGASPAQIEPSVAPSIPARPTKSTHQVPPADAQLTDPNRLSKTPSNELKKAPSLPDRAKPQIPPRPGKKPADEELSKVRSAESTESTDTQAPAKAKPQVPARPAGSKIAALQGNFMSDLNKRLGLGPPKEKEKEPEPETEAKPLEDARKGRARGPQRRAPAKSPSAAAESSKPRLSFSMFTPRSLWQINDSDELTTIFEDKEKEDKQEQGGVSILDHASSPEPATAEKDVAEPSEDVPGAFPSDSATNTPVEPADPVTAGGDDENLEGELTRKTTASTISGAPIDREDSPAQKHMLSASRMTTASDSDAAAVKEQLEKVPTKEYEAKAEDEPIKVRNEQVGASKPDTHASTGKSTTMTSQPLQQVKSISQQDDTLVPGEDAPKEPMNEDDINYGKLEEMTAKADGKMNSQEDPQAAFSSRKVVD